MRAQKLGAPGHRPAVRAGWYANRSLRRGQSCQLLHREVGDQQPAGTLVRLWPRLAPAEQLERRGGPSPPQRGDGVAGKIHLAFAVHSGAFGSAPREGKLLRLPKSKELCLWTTSLVWEPSRVPAGRSHGCRAGLGSAALTRPFSGTTPPATLRDPGLRDPSRSRSDESGLLCVLPAPPSPPPPQDPWKEFSWLGQLAVGRSPASPSSRQPRAVHTAPDMRSPARSPFRESGAQSKECSLSQWVAWVFTKPQRQPLSPGQQRPAAPARPPRYAPPLLAPP